MDALGTLRSGEYGSHKILDAVERLMDLGEWSVLDSMLESRFGAIAGAMDVDDLDHDFITGADLGPGVLEPIEGPYCSGLSWGYNPHIGETKPDLRVSPRGNLPFLDSRTVQAKSEYDLRDIA